MATKILGWLFRNPRRTVFCLVALGLTSIGTQVIFQWYPDFVASELVFDVFASVSVFAGSLIIYWLPRSLLKAQRLLLESVETQSAGSTIPSGDRRAIALLLLGLVVGLVASYTHFQVGLPWSGLILGLYLGSVFLNFFCVGVVGGLYCVALWRLIELSNTHLDTRPLKWQPQAVQGLSNDYLLIIGVGVLLYLLAILGVWISPGSSGFFAYGGPVRNLWILPLASCIAVYFCFAQIVLHRIAYNAKDAQVSSLREKQQVSFRKWEENGDKSHAEAVEFLDKRIENLSKQGTWPFNLPKAASILLPVFLPAAKQIIGIFDVLFKS